MISSAAKLEQVRSIVADSVFDRKSDVVGAVGENTFDAVVDNVAGPDFSNRLKVLKRGGRYTSSGAIAGHVSERRQC